MALTHESEWCMSVSRGCHVIFEHLENGGEKHMTAVSKAEIIRMWTQLAQGKLIELQSLSWQPGYE